MAVAVVGGLEEFANALVAALCDRGRPATRVASASAPEAQPAAALVRIAVGPAQIEAQPLADLSTERWLAQTADPLRAALAFHQAAASQLAERGGRIIVIVPTTALTGGSGAVALATAAEAERSLAKSQARALASHGITVNCIAVDTQLLTGRPLDRPGLQAQSLPPPTVADVAAVLDGLLSPPFDGVTGQTIAVDGGRWTAP